MRRAFVAWCGLWWQVPDVAALTHQPHWEHLRPPSTTWNFEARNFSQVVNHFSAYGQEEHFSQRYLLDRTSWGGSASSSPMFFFTGAEEGDIDRASGGYGHVAEMAQHLRGMVVFMEARFFGYSQPFGPDSYKPDGNHIGLLSVEQMLLDYVAIISAVRDEFDPDRRCPTIAFGGSLAGTLSAMLRARYPNVVDMSLASSTPLRGYPLPGVDQFAWRRQVTDNWVSLASPVNCPIASLVRRGFAALQAADPEQVRRAFRTCESAYEGNWQDVQGVMWGHLEGTAEFVYPASQSPIPSLCQAAFNVSVTAGSAGLDIFAALLPAASACTNLTAYRASLVAPDALGWSYLSCTEIVHPIGCNNVTDFFPPSDWTVAGTNAYCQSTWNAGPVNGGLWIPETFGFADPARFASSTSHIVFAYGELDPWHVFAISLQGLSPDLPVVMIPGGSHCADMVGGQPADTPAMLEARAQEEAILAGWIKAAQEAKAKTSTLV